MTRHGSRVQRCICSIGWAARRGASRACRDRPSGIGFSSKALAVVIDERVAVSGGGKNSAVRTTYYATVQFQAGDRLEYETYGWLAGRIAAGDLGVAFTKGDTLIDFLRLEA